MARKKVERSPIVPLSAYARLAYQCIRCEATFDSQTGPQPFCEECRKVLSAQGGTDA